MDGLTNWSKVMSDNKEAKWNALYCDIHDVKAGRKPMDSYNVMNLMHRLLDMVIELDEELDKLKKEGA